MDFSRSFTSLDYFFLISFLLVYAIYFYKILQASRALKSSAGTSLIKFFVRGTYFGLMGVAALGPNFGITEVEARELGKDIFLAFDLSESMNANDVEPSRLDKAKVEVLAMLKHFETDRIGIAVFNSDAFILSPLTFDRDNIDRGVRSLNSHMLESGSTDFAPVFDLIAEKLTAENDGRGKAVVLITDGESHFPMSKSDVAGILKGSIATFIVGVGSLAGSHIPTLSGVKKDKDNHEIITRLDIKMINDYAKAANGNYYILNNQKNDISDLIDDLNKVIGVSDQNVHQSVTYNKYVVFLLLALLLMAVDFLVTVKVFKI